MSKEPYVKPEVKTENLEPEALCNAGSPLGGFQTVGTGGAGGFCGGGGWRGCPW